MSPAGGDPADSYGIPWHGRSLTPQPFAGDTGEADPALIAVLAALAGGHAREVEVIAALRGVRLLTPVVAAIGDGHPLPDHVRGDAGAEMSIPLLAGPGGRRALPAFTGVASVAVWDPAARPVPVEAERAALSAVDEGCEAMVLDPGSPHAFVVRRPPLWALAQGRAWVPPADDAELRDAVRAGLAPVAAVRAVRLEPGRGSELAVVVELPAGLTAEELQAVLAQVTERLGAVPLLAERAESIEVRPTAATA